MHSRQQNSSVHSRRIKVADVQKLETELTALGLWNAQGPDGRYRYRYRLIPGQFVLTNDMKQQLGDIAQLTRNGLFACVSLCVWLGAKHRDACESGGVPLTPAEASFYKMLKASCGGYEFGWYQQALPPVVKVDLAWDGSQFQVLKLDTYNPRGLAYALWFRYVHERSGEVEARHPALVEALRRAARGSELVWLYSERERYYAPVLQAFAKILTAKGVPVRVVAESQLPACTSTSIQNFLTADERLLIVPDRMSGNVATRIALVQFVLQCPEQVVFPCVPYLGCKGLLAFLTNGNRHEEIAYWQQRFIAREVQELAQQYIPEAVLLGKSVGTARSVPEFVQTSRAVLKAINSSGAKGVTMPVGDAAEYQTVLASARTQKSPNYIAQRLIAQQPMMLDGSSGPESHLVRVTAYVDTATGQCLDAELTGTGDDPLVHGGTECVQLPAIF